jgi:two-component system sensor histidine kinase VicK
MKIHFFSGTTSGQSAFRSYYVLQNLKTVRTTSLIYLSLSLLIRIAFFVYNLRSRTANHINEFDSANWVALIANPLFYFASISLISKYKGKLLERSQILVFAFSLFLIVSCMRATFLSMYNPRNTMVMYLMGLIIIGVFFTFEFYETIFITLVAGISFAVMLPFYQHGVNELVLNNLASSVLLTGFFCISRYSFSYKADNFFKLKAIEEKNIEIENASQVKNEILGVVAHDLRNPLATIQTITTLMAMEADMNDEYHDNLQMIRISCEKASSIINDLIETAQNELLGGFELEKIDLSQFLAHITDEWVKNKKGQINILYQDSIHAVYAHIHQDKMQRVMDNLISNAIKFSGESDHIEISLTELDDEAVIHVRDFGIGIPEDLQPYIFDRFSKARRNGVRGEASVGLGLSIVQQIVRKHNGEIEVSSTEKSGTTFAIRLPQTQA